MSHVLGALRRRPRTGAAAAASCLVALALLAGCQARTDRYRPTAVASPQATQADTADPGTPATAPATVSEPVTSPSESPVAPVPPAATAATPPASPGPAPEADPWRPLPAGAVVDVRTFGADGTDTADDTAALSAAIQATDGRPLYLPVGTYLVSRPLAGRTADGSWRGGLWLVGEDRERSVLRLVDGAEGFGDPASPRAVLATGSYHFAEDYGGDIGEGNEAYNNRIENLTVDTGTARGAVGIDYLANNSGSIRHVTVTGTGTTGIALTRRYPGPALLSDVAVRGFGVGIDVAHPEYGLTLDRIRLSGQSVAGVRNDGNVLSISDLRSTNSVAAVRTTGSGLVTVTGAVLDGGDPGVSAVEDDGSAGVVLRDVTSSGYRSLVARAGAVVPGSAVDVWSSARTGAQDGPSLPVRATPDPHETDLSRWVDVASFGAVRDDWLDDGAAIQAALDSGATTLYLAPGRYFTSATLRVPPGVRMIHGFGSTIAPAFGAFTDPGAPAPLLEAVGDSSEPLVVQHLSVGKLHQSSAIAGLVCFQQSSGRTLVLRATACDGGEAAAAYRGSAGAGPLFIEDSVLLGVDVAAGQQVWARQLDSEGLETRVTNRGGQVWIQGIKTEGGGTVVETTAGGRTELAGGLLYPAFPVGDAPAFVTSGGGSAVLSYATSAWAAGQGYVRHVHAGPGQASLGAGELPGRTAHGHTVVLHSTGG